MCNTVDTFYKFKKNPAQALAQLEFAQWILDDPHTDVPGIVYYRAWIRV